MSTTSNRPPIMVVGDFHVTPFGEFSRSLDKDGNSELSDIILKTAKFSSDLYCSAGCGLFVNNGDYTSTPGVLTPPVQFLISKIEQIFDENGIKRAVNIGNHDIDGKNGLNNLFLLGLSDNISLARPNEVMEIDGVYIVPFTYSMDLQRSLLATIPDDSVVCVHTPIIGIRMSPTADEENGIHPSEFERFKVTISSHYHLPQIVTNESVRVIDNAFRGVIAKGSVVSVGAPLARTFSDTLENYFITIFDLNGDEVVADFVPNPYSPIFQTQEIDSLDQLDVRDSDRRKYISIVTTKELAEQLRNQAIGDNIRSRIKIKKVESEQGRSTIIRQNFSIKENLFRYLDHVGLKIDKNKTEDYLQELQSKLRFAPTPLEHVDFHSLELVDFMSWGHAELKFGSDGMILISGSNNDTSTASSNGSGKTSLLEALVWALYDTTVRGADFKDQIIRTGSRHGCTVSVEFSVGGERYRVIRRRKSKEGTGPVIHKLVSGEWEDISNGLASSINSQIIDIIGIPFNFFSLISFFGSNNRNRFTLMTDSERKDFLSTVLGLNQYDDLGKLVNSDLNDSRNSLKSLEIRRENEITNREKVFSMIGQEEVSIREEKESDRQKIEEAEGRARTISLKLNELKVNIEKLKETRDFKSAELVKISAGIVDYSGSISTVENHIRNLNRDLETFKKNHAKKVEELENVEEKCPVCGGKLSEEKISSVRNLIQLQIEELINDSKETARLILIERENLNKLLENQEKGASSRSKLGDMELEINKLDREIGSLASDATSFQNHMAIENATIETLKKKNYEVRLERLLALKASSEKSIAEIDGMILEGTTHHDFLSSLGQVFGNKGLISFILDESIQKINDYLEFVSSDIFGGDYSISLKSSRELKKGGEENKINIEYSTLAGNYSGSSDGEKRKADISIFLALNAFVNSLGRGSTNIIVADEILDSLDQVASRFIVESLERFSKEERRVVFLISHSDSVNSLVPEVLFVEKTNGISRIANNVSSNLRRIDQETVRQ